MTHVQQTLPNFCHMPFSLYICSRRLVLASYSTKRFSFSYFIHFEIFVKSQTPCIYLSLFFYMWPQHFVQWLHHPWQKKLFGGRGMTFCFDQLFYLRGNRQSLKGKGTKKIIPPTHRESKHDVISMLSYHILGCCTYAPLE